MSGKAKDFGILRLKSQSGMGLTELVIAGALTSIFILATSQVIISNKKSEMTNYRINSLDQAHLISVQSSRNLNNVRDQLKKLNIDITDSHWSECLGGAGGKDSPCLSQDLAPVVLSGVSSSGSGVTQSPTQTTVPSNQGPGSYSGGNGGTTAVTQPDQKSSEFKSTAKMSIECSSAFSCDLIRIEVRTADQSSQGQKLADRVTTIVIPGPSVASRSDLGFNCAASSQLTTGIDFHQLRDVCNAAPTVTLPPCAAAGPLGSFDGQSTQNCQPTENVNCPGGVVEVGMFAGSSSCGAAPPTLPPPSAPPTVTVPTCPANANLSWTVGGVTCNGVIGMGSQGSIVSANDVVGTETGSANYQCTSTGWVGPSSATCVAAPTTTTVPSCQADGALVSGLGISCTSVGNNYGAAPGICCSGSMWGYCSSAAGLATTYCGSGPVATTTSTLPPACTPDGVSYGGLGYCATGAGVTNIPSDPKCCSGKSKMLCAFIGDTPEITCGAGPATTTTLPPACINNGQLSGMNASNCSTQFSPIAVILNGTDPTCCSETSIRGGTYGPCWICGNGGGTPPTSPPITTTTTLPPSCAANGAVVFTAGGSDPTPCYPPGGPGVQANSACCSGYDVARSPGATVVGEDSCTRVCTSAPPPPSASNSTCFCAWGSGGASGGSCSCKCTATGAIVSGPPTGTPQLNPQACGFPPTGFPQPCGGSTGLACYVGGSGGGGCTLFNASVPTCP
jgi:hypothetical protein